MSELGATQSEIDAHLERFAPDDDFEVLEENWPIVSWFLDVYDFLVWDSGWCARLDVSAIEADAKLSGRKIKPADYRGLKVMFAAFCQAINEKRKKGLATA